VSGLIRRLTKEELRKFDGSPLFPERKAYTIQYQLSELEAQLYAAVTQYVRNEMRTDISKALDGRNAVSHTSSEILVADAISYLTAIRGVAEAISAKAVVDGVKPLIDDQIKAAAKAMGVAPEIAVKTLTSPVAPQLDLGDGRYSWKPWRDVVPPTPM
jgi:hypothetical protein